MVENNPQTQMPNNEAGPQQPIPVWEELLNKLHSGDLDYEFEEKNGEIRTPVKDALMSLITAEKIPTPENGVNIAEITTCGIASIGFAMGLDKTIEVMPALKRFVGKKELLYATLRELGDRPPIKYSPKQSIENMEQDFRTANGFLWAVHQKVDPSKIDPIQDATLLKFFAELGIADKPGYLPHMFAGVKRNGDKNVFNGENPFFDVFDICGKKSDPNKIFFGLTPGQLLEHAKSYGPPPNDQGYDYPQMLVKWL